MFWFLNSIIYSKCEIMFQFIKETIMHFSSIRTPSVDNNLYLPNPHSYLLHSTSKMWNKQVVNIQTQYDNDDITVYSFLYNLILDIVLNWHVRQGPSYFKDKVSQEVGEVICTNFHFASELFLVNVTKRYLKRLFRLW